MTPPPDRGRKQRRSAFGLYPYLLLYPTLFLKQALAQNPSLYASVFAALRSLDSDAIKTDRRDYGGGLFKMEPKEMANVPAGFLVEGLRVGAGVEVVRPGGLIGRQWIQNNS